MGDAGKEKEQKKKTANKNHPLTEKVEKVMRK